MIKNYILNVALIVVATFSFTATAQTVLTAGDVAIVGYNAAPTHEVSIMLLTEIVSGTQITITNRSWKAAQDGFQQSFGIDDAWTLTAGSTIPSGTIIKLNKDGSFTYASGDAAVSAGSSNQDYGTDGDWDLNGTGESILVYQPAAVWAEPTSGTDTGWLAGLAYSTAGFNGGGGNQFCARPTALTDGTDIVDMASNQVNGVYNADISSPTAVAINTNTNWDQTGSPTNLWEFNKTIGGVSGSIGSGPLSVSEIATNANISISPNPATDLVSINGVDVISASLVTTTGSIVKTSNTNSIDLSDVASGIYFVVVETANGTTSQKVIKK